MVDALFPSEKKRDLKIKTIRGDEIQISIISFSAISIKNSTAASHLTGRGKKREGGGRRKKGKSDKIERAKRKKWREKHFRFTLITFNWNRIHGGKGKTDSNGVGTLLATLTRITRFLCDRPVTRLKVAPQFHG